MDILAAMLTLLVAAMMVAPAWPYSATWGYYPSGVCGLVALLTAALVVIGRL